MQFFDWLKRKAADVGAAAKRRTDFDPGPDAIEIRYRNYRNEEKTFVGDRRTLRHKGNSVSLRVVPTGERIALRLARILNRAEVEGLVASRPSPNEWRVLIYHKQHGTTSRLYERLRSKYPDA